MSRSCGTCRFYHPLPLPAQGRCAHPERRALIRNVFVRERELACRDRHDMALWERNPAAPSEVVLATLPVVEYVAGNH